MSLFERLIKVASGKTSPNPDRQSYEYLIEINGEPYWEDPPCKEDSSAFIKFMSHLLGVDDIPPRPEAIPSFEAYLYSTTESFNYRVMTPQGWKTAHSSEWPS